MKNKFLMLSLLVSLFFIGCSGDDDGGSDQDSIIGTWQYSSALEDGVVYGLTDCEKQTTFTFSANGTYTGQGYNDESDCTSSDINGTWKKNENGTYNFITSESSSNNSEVVFSNNNNTMSLIDTEGTTVYTDIYTKQ